MFDLQQLIMTRQPFVLLVLSSLIYPSILGFINDGILCLFIHNPHHMHNQLSNSFILLVFVIYIEREKKIERDNFVFFISVLLIVPHQKTKFLLAPHQFQNLISIT